MTQPNIATLPIPDPVDPGETICLQITVPKSRDHIAAFWGAIYTLTTWNAWDRDDAHSGKQVAALWTKALNTLTDCAGNPIRPGFSEAEVTQFRVDCNCNVYVECCDGTEKQILTSDQVKAAIGNPATAGAPQPAPGACQDYQGVVQANSSWLIPTPVSTGDVITLTAANGSSAPNALAVWNCPDGLIFFSGGCVDGTERFDPAAPLPAAPVGALILQLNGSYYDLRSPVTVPSGVSLVQPTVLLNYASGGTPGGTITLTVRVCNNAVAGWSHDINFALTGAGFVPLTLPTEPNFAVYSPGFGWVQNQFTTPGNGPTPRFSYCYIGKTWTTPTTLTKVEITYNMLYNGYAVDVDPTIGYGTILSLTTLQAGTPSTGAAQTLTWAGSQAGLTNLILITIGTDAGNGNTNLDTTTLYKLHVEGTGFDPFA